MSKKVISCADITISFDGKTLIEDFSIDVYLGEKVGIIGRNGTGKTSLLKILAGIDKPASGLITINNDIEIGYVGQLSENITGLSGAENFNKRLTRSLMKSPDVLLLDEPTNHLDRDNRKSLMRMLKKYDGSLIVATHDVSLLRNCVDVIWHVDQSKITIFHGTYDNYKVALDQKRSQLEQKLVALRLEKKEMHTKLMKEQSRSAKKKKQGEKKIATGKWMKMVGDLKGMKAEKSQGKKLTQIDKKRSIIADELKEIYVEEEIMPHFSLDASSLTGKNVVEVFHGAVGYTKNQMLVRDIHFSLGGKEKMVIVGENASGKTTIFRVLLGGSDVVKEGDWYIPCANEIGYLDQGYKNLDSELSVFDHIKNTCNNWSDHDIRLHLNGFLFRTNSEVFRLSKFLSGGEKMRLSLAIIAVQSPKLLLLDEITNNIDLETKHHVINVLKNYPGSVILISHDDDFIDSVGVDKRYLIKDKKLFYVDD